MKSLRPYQAEGIDALRQSLRSGKRRPVLQLPTGGGKTRIAAEIIGLAREKGHRAIFTVPRISLIDQTVEAFLHEGVSDLGVIQQSHELTDPSRPVQIASLDTLARREVPPSGLVIVDEAHLQREFLLDDWMKRPEWQRVPFIGLTATPWAKGMAKHWDDLVVVSTTREMIDAGHLSDFRVFAPSHPDLSGVKVRGGDYVEGQLSEVMSEPKLVADVVNTWLEKGGNQPTLCFAVDRAHAKHLQRQFEAAGVPCGYVDCHTSLEGRAEVGRQFRNGDIRVICNVGVLTTGVDYDVRTLILARPTRSEILFTQIIGRALRTAPGKQFATILDHSDTHLKLGFVTDIHHETLNDGKEAGDSERKAALPKECPQCHYLKAPKVRVCPACGFETKHQPRDIACDDGELIEVKPRKGKLDTDAKVEIFGQLKLLARRRGYSSGWASHKFREMTGVWPNHVKWAPEAEPTPELLDWIRSRQIAYAKRREGNHAVAAR